MNQNEVAVGVNANVLIQVLDAAGREKERREIHNTVTTAGIQGMADQLLASPALVKPGWMEVGTGTGGTTKLNAYVSGSRVALTSKTRGSNAIVTMIGDFGLTIGTGALTEAGLFAVVTEDTGPMWCYATFQAINKLATDTLRITWTLTVTAA
jgi:hypothetical protein